MTEISSEEARLRDLRKRATELQKATELNEQAIEKCKAKLEELKPWKPKGGQWECHWSSTVEAGFHRDDMDQALQATKEIRTYARLLSYRDEFDPGFVWKHGYDNFSIVWDNRDGCWECIHDRIYCRTGVVYMSSKVAEELVAKLRTGKVKLYD